MLEGLYTAAAGMAAQQFRLDATADDLANVSTAGYKPARVAFRDLLYAGAVRGGDASVQLGAGSAASIVGRSVAQGAIQTSTQSTDVAVEGSGFLQVRLADGTKALTRDGVLKIDGQGRLGLHSGQLLEPQVKLPAGATANDLRIAPDGTATVRGQAIGRLTLVTVPAPSALAGGPDNTFVPTATSGAARAAGAGTTVRQYALESSAVDTAEAFTQMIEAQRGYELASKAITTHDQLMEIANGLRR